MTTEIFRRGSVEASDRDERAQRAVAAFRALQPTLSAYARVLTGDPTVRVEMAARDNGSTDGKRIFMRPPIQLGDKTPHERSMCDKRDGHLQLLCPACSIREAVLVTIYHEIAHIAFDTFGDIPERDKQAAIGTALKESGGRWAKQIAEKILRAPSHVMTSYIALAHYINEFLPILVNCIEDARVNNALFKARKGTKKMFDADTWRIFDEGVEQKDAHGNVIYKPWSEYSLNSQVMCGVFCKASGYDYSQWFHPVVVEALDDSKLSEIMLEFDSIEDASGVYHLSVKVMNRLRELGFLGTPMDPELEPEPKPEEEEDVREDEQEQSDSDSVPDEPGVESEGEAGPGDSGDGSEEQEHEDESGDSEEDSAEGSAGDGGDSEGDQDGSGSGGRNDSSGEEPEEGDTDRGDDDQDSQEDDHQSTGDESDSPSERTDESDDDGGSGDAAKGDSVDEQGQASSEASDSDDAEGEDDFDSGEPSESSGGDQQDDSGDGPSGDGADEGSDDDGAVEGSGSQASGDVSQPAGAEDSPSDRDGSPGSDSSDVDADADTLDEAASGELADQGSDESADRLGEEGSGEEHAGVGKEDQESSVPADDDLIDTGADDGYGGTDLRGEQYDDLPPMGTPEDTEAALLKWGDHEEKPKSVEAKREDEAMDKAIIQGIYFTTPSNNVWGVREHTFNQHVVEVYEDNPALTHDFAEGWTHEYWGSYGHRAGHGRPIDIEETTLSQALLRMRVAFSDNKRGHEIRHRKSGRVDAKVLGRRAATKDPRLFKKKIQPGKKDYAVLIGGDISGSTVGMNLHLEKMAMMAQAELCDRMGIKFAVYAHSGDSVSAFKHGRGVSMDIYIIKDFNEPWSSDQKRALFELGPHSVNLDGHTMEYYRKVLERMPVTDKVLMYYTDGKMPAENHDEELQILRREIQTCKQKDITLMGVGIRTDSPIEHGLDTVQVDDEEDIIKVVKHLEKRLAG